jgi:phage terminase large subunit-like protein
LENADRLAGAVEQGRVYFVRGPWLDQLVDELEEFPGGAHDDQVDALSLGFKVLGDRVPPQNPQAGQAAARVLVPARSGRS